MSEWMKYLPFWVASFLRTAVRGLIGLTLVFLALFLAWFTFAFLVKLRGLFAKSLFGHDWY